MLTLITAEMSYREAEEAYEENIRSLFNPGLNGGMCLIVDVTGSMAGIIAALMRNLTKYCDAMFKGQIDRMSLVCMDDHYNSKEKEKEFYTKYGYSSAVKFTKVTNDAETYKGWLKDYPHGNGADAPECWACSIDAARKLDPEANIWLCTDAPPHGTKYHNGVWSDTYPGGCPCGIDLDLTGVSLLQFGRESFLPQDYYLATSAGVPINHAQKYWEANRKAVVQNNYVMEQLKPSLKKLNPDGAIPFSMGELQYAFDKFLGGK